MPSAVRAHTVNALRLWHTRVLYAAFLAATPATAQAQSTGSCANPGSSAMLTSLANITSALQYLAGLFSNTWLKLLLLIAVGIAFALVMFDGGQLPGIVKLVLSVFIGAAIVFAILAWIAGSSNCVTISS